MVNSKHLKGIIIITVYKYTYLLSDSYRRDAPLSATNIHNYSGMQPALNLSRQHIALSQHQQTRNNDQNTLQVRLRNLMNLGQRHESALREVDLQNKLKKISDKYTSKGSQKEHNLQKYRNSQESNVSSYKNQRDVSSLKQSHQAINQHRPTLFSDISFSRLPQRPVEEINNNYNITHSQTRKQVAYSRQKTFQAPRTSYQSEQQKTFQAPRSSYKPQQDVTRHKVKGLIDRHLQSRTVDNSLSQTRQRIDSVPNRAQQQAQSVQKLSKLQDRIKASLNPHLIL